MHKNPKSEAQLCPLCLQPMPMPPRELQSKHKKHQSKSSFQTHSVVDFQRRQLIDVVQPIPTSLFFLKPVESQKVNSRGHKA
jgi:hypothetical protein